MFSRVHVPGSVGCEFVHKIRTLANFFFLNFSENLKDSLRICSRKSSYPQIHHHRTLVSHQFHFNTLCHNVSIVQCHNVSKYHPTAVPVNSMSNNMKNDVIIIINVVMDFVVSCRPGRCRRRRRRCCTSKCLCRQRCRSSPLPPETERYCNSDGGYV